jgi:hypothetical protein
MGRASLRGLPRVVMLILIVLTTPASAAAQDTVSDILTFLLTNRSVVTGDFDRDEAALQAASDAISNALLLEVATLPLSSSSGAFTYRFNPALGTAERASTNFGAFFVERAVTAGRGRASVGVTFRYSRFETLDDFDLRDGTLVVTANRFTDEAAPFDQELLTLRLQTATTTAFVNVGLTDWLDVGAAVPVVSLKLEGERVDDFRGRRTLLASAAANVTGLADMALRTKVRLAGRHGSGLALGGEVRLPTGNREDLLGAGEATYRALAIGSLEGSHAAMSGNVSYSTGGIADEIGYGVNLTLAPAARVSFSVEVFGRSVDGIGPIAPLTQPHPTIAGVDTIRLGQAEGDLRTSATVAGFKWNVGGAWLLNANVLVPLGSRGLQTPWTPAVSLEYAFGR